VAWRPSFHDRKITLVDHLGSHFLFLVAGCRYHWFPSRNSLCRFLGLLRFFALFLLRKRRRILRHSVGISQRSIFCKMVGAYGGVFLNYSIPRYFRCNDRWRSGCGVASTHRQHSSFSSLASDSRIFDRNPPFFFSQSCPHFMDRVSICVAPTARPIVPTESLLEKASPGPKTVTKIGTEAQIPAQNKPPYPLGPPLVTPIPGIGNRHSPCTTKTGYLGGREKCIP